LRQQFEQSEKDSAELRMQVEAALCHTMQEDTAELKALEDTHEDTKKQLKVAQEETGASQEAIESLQQQLKASQEELDKLKALEDTHEDTKKQLKVAQGRDRRIAGGNRVTPTAAFKASQEKLDNAKRALMTFRAAAAAEDNDDDWDPHEAASEI
jgi:chromosome segregation ATPase